ncbi:MAG TPA: [protein-PII] uridylyltransferase [Verrucomicrobiae bacterium]|nr:[protein-PII] uridylyltransferase [Verrucomicrobiae bacterium]
MQDLVAKIEADAATRLELPEGRSPAQELSRYKQFLKVETHRLKILHRSGSAGTVICHGRTLILDVLLRYLWDAARNSLSPQAQKEFPPLALVAIGGYGRGELNPYSDIDFMFLHEGQLVAGNKPLPHLSKIIDGILYPLWDIGLKVGHSVRSVDDCVKVANSDMQSKTSLIESRLITGSEALFNRFQKTLLAKCVRGYEDRYIAMRLEDQTARRNKFGNSACMQEPNVKNGCGGLRDYQSLLWMTFFKYGTRSLKDLQQLEFVSGTEGKQLESAYDFLLRVRTEMHYHTNRATDVLSKNLQPAVAHNLGYAERSPSKRIEHFMREFYIHSRNIFLITRTLEKRMALAPRPERGLSLRSLLPMSRRATIEPVDGFKFVQGEIHAVSQRVFRDQPRRLMRVFLYAQQRGLRLHPDLAQLIRNQISLADRQFLNDQHVRETFLTILGQRGNVSRILRAMHEVDLLGKYVPEFGKLTCLVQHEFYHQYTADEHTLMCLEQLDRIWEAKTPPYDAYAPLFQKLERPFLLYLALLLHDTGKPAGHGNHSAVSAELALRAARRLGLDGSDTHTLRVLVENHLTMASVSQRRDMDDPMVIRQFAKQVQSVETLSLLTLLTFADSQATSDKLWNGFKDALLWSLQKKTLPLLAGETEFLRVEEQQRQLLMDEVDRLLDGHLVPEEVQAHFAALPPRYFQIHSAREIHDDLLLTHRFMRLQISEEESPLIPVVNWHNEPDRGCNAVKVCTWDRAGLFSKIAGSFSAAGLNILSAQIFTRADGIVLDTFFVTDARTGNLADREQRDEFEKILNRVLTDGEVDFQAMVLRHKLTRPLYQAYSGECIPTRVSFDNEASETRTVVEIETEDRLGLLYAISQALSEVELDISAAKICTERGAAIDSFYVRELDGGKILLPERQSLIERKLVQAIQRLEAVPLAAV